MVPDFEVRKVVDWGKRAMTNYTQTQSGKGDLGDWWRMIGSGRIYRCAMYGKEEESGDHVAFECTAPAMGREWSSWESMELREV